MEHEHEQHLPSGVARSLRAHFERRLRAAKHQAVKARAFWEELGELPDGTRDRWGFLCHLAEQFGVGPTSLATAVGWGGYVEDGGVIPNAFFEPSLGISRQERARLAATRHERRGDTLRVHADLLRERCAG